MKVIIMNPNIPDTNPPTHQHLWYHGTNRLLLRQEALSDHADRKYYMKLTAFHELYSGGVQYHFDLTKSRCRLYLLIKAQATQGKVVVTSQYHPSEIWGNDPIVHMFTVKEVDSTTTVIEETDAHRDKRVKLALAKRVTWGKGIVECEECGTAQRSDELICVNCREDMPNPVVRNSLPGLLPPNSNRDSISEY